MDELNILIKFISAWNWHLIAMMFLIGAIIVITLPVSIKTIIISIAFLIVFFFSEVIAYLRQREVYNE